MNEKIFTQFLKFYERVKPYTLIVSGGEPTLHPNFFNYVDRIIALRNKLRYNTKLIILSNGLFFTKDESLKNKMINLLNRNEIAMLQINNDPNYYPIKVDLAKIRLLHHIIKAEPFTNKMIPLGRAKNLKNIKELSKNSRPSCTNLYLIAYQIKFDRISEFLMILEQRGIFCPPTITPLGDIVFGESVLCNKWGSIFDNDKLLIQKLYSINMCNNCGLYNNIVGLPKILIDTKGFSI